MSTDIFEATTLEKALEQAAGELGVHPDEIEHEVVEQRSGDFWGGGDSAVKIRAWVLAPQQDVSAPAPEEPEEVPAAEPVAAASSRSPEAPAEAEASPRTGAPVAAASAPSGFTWGATDDVPAEEPTAPAATSENDDLEVSPEEPPGAEVPPAEVFAADPSPTVGESAPKFLDEELKTAEDVEGAVTGLLERTFGAMDFRCDVATSVEDGGVNVKISGDDIEYLLDSRGRGLSALELILNHAFWHRPGEMDGRIRVDAGGFRTQRDDEIRDLSYQASHRAKETGDDQRTREMNPYERRIVHLTLADDPGVTTRSEGSGFDKVVKVIPTGGRS